jgi:hypothetical protein
MSGGGSVLTIIRASRAKNCGNCIDGSGIPLRQGMERRQSHLSVPTRYSWEIPWFESLRPVRVCTRFSLSICGRGLRNPFIETLPHRRLGRELATESIPICWMKALRIGVRAGNWSGRLSTQVHRRPKRKSEYLAAQGLQKDKFLVRYFRRLGCARLAALF